MADIVCLLSHESDASRARRFAVILALSTAAACRSAAPPPPPRRTRRRRQAPPLERRPGRDRGAGATGRRARPGDPVGARFGGVRSRRPADLPDGRGPRRARRGRPRRRHLGRGARRRRDRDQQPGLPDRAGRPAARRGRVERLGAPARGDGAAGRRRVPGAGAGARRQDRDRHQPPRAGVSPTPRPCSRRAAWSTT